MRDARAAVFVLVVPVVLAALLTPAALAPAEEPAVPESEELPLVAVIELQGNNVSLAEASALTDRLRVEMWNTGQFAVLERARMEDLLKEQGFQLAGTCDESRLVEVGKLLPVRKMVGGSVSRVGDVYALALQIVDVETGKLEQAITEDCTCPLDQVLTRSMGNAARKLGKGAEEPAHEEPIGEGPGARRYLGMIPRELTPRLAKAMGLAPHQGILVARVFEDGPADEAGLRSGDLIVAFAGEPVNDVAQFKSLVAARPVDAAVQVRYVRNGDERETELTIGQRPSGPGSAGGARSREVWLGIRVEEISGRDAERRGLPSRDRALVVLSVIPGSVAENAGIRAGDVIRRVEGKEVRSFVAYRKVASVLREKRIPIVFLIERNKAIQRIAIRPGKE